jgi:hypothetical protein
MGQNSSWFPVFMGTFPPSALYFGVAMEKYLSRNGWCCGLIGLFTVLLWGQTVRFAFVWDDQIYIAQNKSIRSLANIPKFFYSMDAQSAERPSVSYRPLRNTVYAMLDALGGKPTPQPWIFHLADVLWHAAAAMLLFLVASLLCERLTGWPSKLARLASVWVALGFAAHPVASEVVCWAKCMDDLMAGVFVLAAARALLKWNRGRRGYIASLVWFLLAVFSKESAVPFALVVFLILYGFHALPRWRSMKLTVPFLLVAFFYAACQHVVMGRSSQCPPLSGTYGQTLLDMFPVGVEYLRLLLGIPPFLADYNFMVGGPPHPFFSSAVLAGVFLLLFFCVLSAWLWRRPQWRLSSMGLLWAALFLLPVSNLVPMMQYMAERFLYLPLMGFVLALGGAFLNISRVRACVAAPAALALVVIWSGTSLSRMRIWRDEVSLFVGTALEHPGIKRVEQNAVGAILRLPQIEATRPAQTLSPTEAAPIIGILEKARQLFPTSDALTTQLGVIEMKTGRLQEAESLLELAAQENPASAERWYNLASIERMAGQPSPGSAASSNGTRT